MIEKTRLKHWQAFIIGREREECNQLMEVRDALHSVAWH